MKASSKFAGRAHNAFHLHPLNATFSLIASMILTLLVVLLMALSAK